MERFPLDLVRQPTAVVNRDARDVYNNVVLFTVQEDQSKGSPAEMHIFHVISSQAQRIVDDIKAAQARLGVGPGSRGGPMSREHVAEAEERRKGVQKRVEEYDDYIKKHSECAHPVHLSQLRHCFKPDVCSSFPQIPPGRENTSPVPA